MLVAVAFCGCRMNNGDIGDFFGSWLLYSMTIDGNEAENFDTESTYWEFQNNIIEISRVDSHYQKWGRWGTWVDDGDRLLLDYTHGDEDYAPGTDIYQAPEWLYFPSNQIIVLNFVERQSKRMVLSMQDDKDRRIVYSLRKIW